MSTTSRRVYALALIVLAVVIYAALNIALDASVTNAKIDLTENGLFTLSRGTKSTIEKLQEPITLKFFYSKKVASDYAQIQAYANRVRDLLHNYAAISDGKIILEEIDPEPFTPAEDEAVSDGLTGAPTESGDMVYFGLVGTNTIDGKEAIPFFSQDREAYLEYDLTSLIYRLSTPKKPVLGIITSLPLDVGAGGMMAAMQGRAQPYIVYEQLRQTYDTRMVPAEFDRIPADVDVLMIAHPTSLNDTQTYAIDQFVLRGGRVLVFVDPNSEMAQPAGGIDPQSGQSPVSDLPKLFKAWGIAYDPDKVVVDRSLAQHVQISADPRNPVTAYPLWLHLTPDNFDKHDPLTANLQVLNLASVGFFTPLKGATTKFIPLVQSSDLAMPISGDEARSKIQPEQLMASIRATGERYAIAARISGPVKTAFPDGPPPQAANAPPLPAEIKSSKADANIVVVADTDLLDDRFWVRVQDLYGKRLAATFADNGSFVLNAVENLMGSDDLISLRTRATNDRPFTVVQKLQADAQAQFQSEADALKQKMTDTQDRLRALQQGANGANLQAGAAAQQSEIERFRRELLDTRSQLRDVQHNLRKEVDRLGEWLAFINIALVPLLVAVFAIGLALLRRRRRARALSL
ncbi:MAG TPA: Gldg family protein [Rhizomicrobium sp.]|nr:Gldg family protein [Rhizomicrobium sp.]